jgi:UDP-GlcNAc:undecaprenyl-phosphate GlcNAc-1-phosphate transferase
MPLLETKNIILLVILCSLNFLFIFLSSKQKKSLFNKKYTSLQRIHIGDIPRLGGLSIYFTILIMLVFFDYSFSKILFKIWLLCLPVALITVLEDIFFIVRPKYRMIGIILSSILLILIIDFKLPIINIIFLIDFFESYPLLLSIILVFCLAIISNGFNMIDGANGILLFTIITILLNLLTISYVVNDIVIYDLSFFLLIILLIQFCINYPFGKIFMGDLGAYVMGLIIGFISILLFGNNLQLRSWLAVLVLFYPAYEVLFTIYRRMYVNESISQADRYHLHHLIFKYLNRFKSLRSSNNIILIILLPLVSFGFIWISIFGIDMNLSLLFTGIIVNIILYNAYYFLFKKLSN